LRLQHRYDCLRVHSVSCRVGSPNPVTPRRLFFRRTHWPPHFLDRHSDEEFNTVHISGIVCNAASPGVSEQTAAHQPVEVIQGRQVYNPYPNLAQHNVTASSAESSAAILVDHGDSSAESLPPLPPKANAIKANATLRYQSGPGHPKGPPNGIEPDLSSSDEALPYPPPRGSETSYIADLGTIDSGEMGSAEASVDDTINDGLRSVSGVSEREWLESLMKMRMRTSGRQPLFREPSARQDVLMRAVKSASMGLPRTRLKKTTVAGKGSFGTVYRGTFITEGDVEIPVAVKELHADVSEKSRLHFLQVRALPSVFFFFYFLFFLPPAQNCHPPHKHHTYTRSTRTRANAHTPSG
jgi:hypothetical protein